jgi:hypothetical protein
MCYWMYCNMGKDDFMEGFYEKYCKCCRPRNCREFCNELVMAVYKLFPTAFVFCTFVFDIVAIIMLEVNYDSKNGTKISDDLYFHFYEGGVTVVRDLAYVMVFFIYKDSVFQRIGSDMSEGKSSLFSLYSPVSMQESHLHTSGLMKAKKFVEIDYDM